MQISFDQYCQEANKFINALSKKLGYEDDKSHSAFVLRSVLHVLRDRITISESLHVLAQLPMFLKALYVDGWKYKAKPDKIKSIKEFLEKVNEDQLRYSKEPDFYKYVIDENTVRTVFKALEIYISEGEIKNVISQLPEELKTLMNP